ncbi:MAG: DUF3179 domain-containing protein [Xanthomonadales bacterium]|nr:DUF3179 domain-containing protein [Xanthomonadales bacterium]
MKNKTMLILLMWVSIISTSATGQNNRPGNPRGYSPDALLEVFKLTQADSDVAFDTLMQACPARDCIPSIDQPIYVAVRDVDYLRDDDLVMTLSHNGITRAYPTRILDHHEIVNDEFGTDPVAITYCPLCGSGLAFDRRHNGQVLEFGVSSLLHNSDLVMYDRQTESLWQQITGEAFAGESRGSQLKTLPLSMVTWSDWREQYPNAEVLTVEGVRTDSYQKTAYGDYAESERLYMPVSATDARLHPKRMILGIEIGDQAIAIDSEWLAKEGSWSSEYEGKKLLVIMNQTGEVKASLGSKAITAHNMYWFAWYTFHPNTALINNN